MTAIIFDIDRTLVDSDPLWRESLLQYALRAGYEPTPDDRRNWYCVDGGSVLVADALGLGDGGADDVRQWCVEYAATHAATMAAMPGAVDMVNTLARIVPVAAATISDREYVDAVAVAFPDMFRHFPAVITRQDVSEYKPHPEAYLQAAARLGVAPESAIAVEDSGSGIKSGHAAGMRVIAIPYAVHPVAQEVLDLADAVCPDAEAATAAMLEMIAVGAPTG